ncbi:MAG: FeoB-associated Cys-rich membrane protein [Lachnospiraceae bacterium]|nr:FeoB-associated Cys-rich membrane protein [Lachnospiraceae bacterium]
MADFITVAVILLIVGAAVLYIVKEKKKGVKCIGCPSAATCAHANANGGCGGSCSGCGGHGDKA